MQMAERRVEGGEARWGWRCDVQREDSVIEQEGYGLASHSADCSGGLSEVVVFSFVLWVLSQSI